MPASPSASASEALAAAGAQAMAMVAAWAQAMAIPPITGAAGLLSAIGLRRFGVMAWCGSFRCRSGGPAASDHPPGGPLLIMMESVGRSWGARETATPYFHSLD